MKGNFQARFWSSGGRGDSPTDCRKLSVLRSGEGHDLIWELLCFARKVPDKRQESECCVYPKSCIITGKG